MDKLGELLADLTSGEAERAEAAALALPKQKGALEKLGKLVRDRDPDLRWWAVRAIAEFDAEQAGELLLTALKDTDKSVRHCAALGLSKHPNPKAVPHLTHLLSESDPLLARLAGDALIAHGKDATEPLIGALEATRTETKVEAARALALIGDTRAIPALFKLLDSDSVLLEHWASEGLEKMGVGMRFFETRP